MSIGLGDTRRDHTQSRLRAVVAATVITCALGSAATPALADSLAYVKGDIPYISATDGTDAHVVTNGQPACGTWEWASATSSGTVYVASTEGTVGVYSPGQPARTNPPAQPARTNSPDVHAYSFEMIAASNWLQEVRRLPARCGGRLGCRFLCVGLCASVVGGESEVDGLIQGEAVRRESRLLAPGALAIAGARLSVEVTLEPVIDRLIRITGVAERARRRLVARRVGGVVSVSGL